MHHSFPTRKSGFSLAELMVAVAILSAVFVGVAYFTIDYARLSFDTLAKVDLNRDVRKFTTQLTENVVEANAALVYPSFAVADRTDARECRAGLSGDFMLLVYERPFPGPMDPICVYRLVGYYRTPELDGSGNPIPGSTGPVRRFEKNFATPVSYSPTNTLQSMYADVTLGSNSPVVLELAQGLANNRLFYNFRNRSVMVRAELVKGNNYRRITDTYNFTVSPRG